MRFRVLLSLTWALLFSVSNLFAQSIEGTYVAVPGSSVLECTGIYSGPVTDPDCGSPNFFGYRWPFDATFTFSLQGNVPVVHATIYNAYTEWLSFGNGDDRGPMEITLTGEDLLPGDDEDRFTGEYVSAGYQFDWSVSEQSDGSLSFGGQAQWIGGRYWETKYDDVTLIPLLDGGHPCDFVGSDNCDINDIDALYAGTNGAPTPLTDEAITTWLSQASAFGNPRLTYVLGDANLDGSVDNQDLGITLNHFGTSNDGPFIDPFPGPVLGWGQGRFNSDPHIDEKDLGLLLNNFPFSSSPAANVVPEPEMQALMMLALFGWVATRRRR